MSGLIKKMYLDVSGNPWELIGRVHTDNYCYCTMRNILTSQEITITDWALRKKYYTV